MKIVCTLKEFEVLSARCPWSTFLISNEKFEELLDKCKEHCLLYNFCQHGNEGKDDNGDWTLADLVEIVPESMK